jgi:large subunit ribosomal protein L15
MRDNTLRPSPGARKRAKRLGCGNGSGHGGTSTRGHKGQKARSGGYHKRGFEGGQMPIARRLPKRGFTNIFSTPYLAINLDQLADWPAGEVVSFQGLLAKGMIRKRDRRIKLLARGDAPANLTVALTAVSASAQKKVEAAGGKVEREQPVK